MNQLVLLGYATNAPEIKQTSTGVKYAILNLKVEKNYQANDGEIEKEIFSIMCWRNMAEEIEKNIKIGTLTAIKGHLNANNYLKEDNTTIYRADIVADKISIF